MTNKKFSWLNVLLVDDSLPILNFVTTVLSEKYGVSQIAQATSAEEALDLLNNNQQLNLLFVDLNMPKVDGVQLLEKVKEANYQGYIVIMSGVATRIISSVELLAQQYKLNHIATLVKPLHENDFDSVFAKLGQSRESTHAEPSLKTYEIIRAIKDKSFKVYYQPQVSLIDRKFVSVEALCRLDHPRLGLVSPDRFIDKAEESELIQHITTFVLKKSLANWRRWHKMGFDIGICVNVSPYSLQFSSFADEVTELLATYDVPAEMLCLEITENILANDQAQELNNLSRLSMQGIKIALDDFGKKHATIDRLQRLPINYVKLDKSYFIEHEGSNKQLELLNTSLALAEKLHISICAEGIENREAMNLATETNCDLAQGYFIAKPLPAKDILSWAHTWTQNT